MAVLDLRTVATGLNFGELASPRFDRDTAQNMRPPLLLTALLAGSYHAVCALPCCLSFALGADIASVMQPLFLALLPATVLALRII